MRRSLAAGLLLVVALLLVARAGPIMITGGRDTAAAVIAPTWINTFTSLPDAEVGTPYSVDLTTYGANLADCYAIGTSRAYVEDIWPTGLTLNTSTCVLSGTPTVADELAVVTVIGTNGTFDASADWAERSGLSNVVDTEDFPDDGSVTDIQSVLSGNDDLSVWDSSVKLYGAGSLRQDTPDTAEYSGNDGFPNEMGAITAEANWLSPINGGTYPGSVTIVPVGNSHNVTFSLRHNRAEVQWPFFRCNTVADCSMTGTQHEMKLAIVDDPVSVTSSSHELVSQSRWGHIHGYTGVGTFNWETGSVATACSGSDFKFNPEVDRGATPLDGADPGLASGDGAGMAWTTCQQARAQFGPLYSYQSTGNGDGFPDPIAGGGFMPFEWWYSLHVHFERTGADETLVEWKWAPLGQDWELLYTDTLPTGGDFGVVTFTQSHTKMLSEIGVRPLAQRWYDGLITRSGATGIPAPGIDSFRSATTRFGIRTVE